MKLNVEVTIPDPEAEAKPPVTAEKVIIVPTWANEENVVKLVLISSGDKRTDPTMEEAGRALGKYFYECLPGGVLDGMFNFFRREGYKIARQR